MRRRPLQRVGGLKHTLRAMPAKCHPHQDLHALNMCRSCYEKDLRRRNPAFAERQRENCRRWHKKYAEKAKAAAKAWRAKQDPVWRFARALRTRFGLTVDEYTAQLRRQGGKCAICCRPPRKTRLAVDHDHKTGALRGLLCFRCNFGLSYFAESAACLARAAAFIRRPAWKRSS